MSVERQGPGRRSSDVRLALVELERTQLEAVLIDLAGALAETEPAQLVRRLVEAVREVAGATLALFLPDDESGALIDASDSDHPGFATAPELRQAPLLAAAVQGTEVLVIDEQPRYHVTGCRSLAAAALIPLPVREAVELGFTPCGWCTPDHTLASRHRATAR